MIMRQDFGFRSRRFAVDVLLGLAALFLAVAAFTATTEPSLLMILALLIGLALLLEPVSAAGSHPLRQTPSTGETGVASVRG